MIHQKKEPDKESMRTVKNILLFNQLLFSNCFFLIMEKKL